MSHTPGPWDLSWMDSDGFTIRVGTILLAATLARRSEDGDQLLEAEANARLMAASPDMFDVIKAYEQWESDLILCNEAWNASLPCMTQELYDRFIEIQSMRNSAIAKAKGES